MNTMETELPKSFNKAYQFINYSIGVGGLKLLTNKYILEIDPFPNLSTSVGVILTFVIVYALGYYAGIAKNWARYVLLIFFIFGMLFIPALINWEISQSFLLVLCSLLQVGLQGYAIYLLFTGECKEWFIEQKRTDSNTED